MRGKYPKIVTAIVLFTAAVWCLFCGHELSAAQRSGALVAAVVKVHDGDTLSVLIGRKKERVRLTGIDAPELGQRPWGARAKRHLEELINSSGRTVSLEPDVQRRDKYGRLLAYLWSGDGKLVNLEMLNDGYAVLFTVPPNVKHVDALRDAQRHARERGLGIWGRDGLKETPGDYRKRHPR
jgi:micrococcal nuclease